MRAFPEMKMHKHEREHEQKYNIANTSMQMEFFFVVAFDYYSAKTVRGKWYAYQQTNSCIVGFRFVENRMTVASDCRQIDIVLECKSKQKVYI